MAREAGEPSAKRAKVDEAEEEEDPLVRRREELVVAAKEARSREDARAERVARRELLTLCADFEAKNEKHFRRLPPELWQKIVDENLDQSDLVALAMTCRFFREKQKGLGWKMATELTSDRVLDLRESGEVTSHTLGWFQWVCDTFEILPGCEWDDERDKGAVNKGGLLNYAALQGSVEILRWLMEEKGWETNCRTGEWAGLGGSVEVLEYLRGWGRGYECSRGVSDGAAIGGHLEALKYLRGLDPPCPWNEWTCAMAAQEGHLDVLKWVRSQDPPCPWDGKTCSGAAKGGRLEVLKWARSQDPPCPWDEGTCAGAAQGGHLDVLKFLRSQDPPCPWDGGSCATAAWKGYLEVLKWLRDQDPPCPWSRRYCKALATGSEDPYEITTHHQHIIDWIDQEEDWSDCDSEYYIGRFDVRYLE